VIFDFIPNELKPKNPKIALVYVEAESGKVVRRSAEFWAKFFGMELYEEVIPLATIDLTTTVLSLKRANATHVIFHHATSAAVLFLKTAEKFGLNLPYLGTTGCTLEDTVKGAGKASKNFWGFCSFSSWYDDTPGTKKMTEISNKYNPKCPEPAW
jgi:ABC-type branched-subunit amino acid transport system substrate-binding protein